ncbi:hypothetical protein TH66_02260 [Carbonactinospora thermoautotrophica]|uniref:Uncharacterized protein n=1 Tax=Carbonactinospora thermoautotrophica TaxID=1469144 RepID=A0A132N694_9ACTN|nr:hypothetical protein TR74_23720 [Carbonactinospora thermoautotrophica]KWX05517.1 hypothetical protein TH66_02260 [Carbonactinospora thermoautotrophica]
MSVSLADLMRMEDRLRVSPARSATPDLAWRTRAAGPRTFAGIQVRLEARLNSVNRGGVVST